MRWSSVLKPAVALAVVAFGAIGAGIASNHPPVLATPGLGMRLVTYLTHNVAETSRYSAFPELRTRSYPYSSKELLAHVVTTAQSMGWKVTEVDERTPGLKAIATTPLLHFKDDVEVRIEPQPDNGFSALELRSASRTGRGDLGTNARRITDFYETLEARL